MFSKAEYWVGGVRQEGGSRPGAEAGGEEGRARAFMRRVRQSGIER